MKETVVPNRNKMFASITQAVALSKANATKEQVDICLGIHAGDHAFILIVDKNLEMQMMQLLELVIGKLKE